MYYLWFRCDNKGKGFFLPDQQNWSGHLTLTTALTGEYAWVKLPVMQNHGVWYVELPAGFTWASGTEKRCALSHCCKLTMVKGSLSLTAYAAECSKGSTAFAKYTLPIGREISIGSLPGNVIQYAELPVSRRHALLVRQKDGTALFCDTSTHGSYVNGNFCKGTQCMLHFGDRIEILPSLQILYLGDCLAINNSQKVKVEPVLSPYALPHAAQSAAQTEPMVTREYHRAPRHVQQANVEPFEIDPPIEKEKAHEMPSWLAIGPSVTMVLPMMISSLVMQRSMIASMAMIGTSSALAVMWGVINRRYQKNQSAINEENRQHICKQYYAEMEELLEAEADRERKRLMYNYLSVEECTQLPTSSEHRLWERMPSHEDFLYVRLGIGEQPLPSPISQHKLKITMVDDPLRHEPQRLYDMYHMMHDVPVLLNLRKHQIIGVLGNRNTPWLMQSMVIQAAANHSYHDVRIAVLHEEMEEEQWRFAKWIPHVYAGDDRTLRMAVCDENAVQEVSQHIDNVLSMRADMLRSDGTSDEAGAEGIGNQIPWYLIFCTDPHILENCSLVRYLTVQGLGFTIILQTSSMELLPKECRIVVDSRELLGVVYEADGSMTGVRFESVDDEQMRRFSNGIAPVRIKEVAESSAIPTLVTFLETYNARRVEELDVRSFWNENHAWRSIKACLGLKAGGVPFYLDISDKNHGPHGLIAGTTGAGKSVLLQSFILSLALNYSPTEVQFILIDYKGGGTSEDFRDLPHAAGVIDSLQGERMIFRALASIKGEILRREDIFKSHGVNNIDDYMQLYNADPEQEPLGHLIIIIDEFAELKKEQPDFMREVVSAARVGRSLGIHLVLATQKPSNSVSDEIEANTRFRVCLRVASKSDSMEMLKRPEAAYLKGMGRCYVQVGNDELFEQVQTSYSGATYAPDALRPEEEPRMLNEAGHPIKMRVKREKDKDNATRAKSELDVVLAYITSICKQYQFAPARKMWLPELSHNLRLEQLDMVRERCFHDGVWPSGRGDELIACFGMADDIDKQRYIPAVMDFVADKNELIVGMAGKGKTTLLQTLAVSLALRYSPQELIMYIFSLTSRTLNSLCALPHVGDIVFEEEEDEQVRLMEMIYAESERRKKLFADLSTDNYIQYNRAVRQSGCGEQVPAIVVMIDRMQQLRSWADKRKEDKLQLFYDMLRSASSQGIYFVLTAFARNELPAKYDPFVHGVALQLSDRATYTEALAQRVPSEWGGIREYPGRGMIAKEDKEAKKTYIYEMQTAYYGTCESDAKRSELITGLGEQMRAAWKGALPRRIDRIPEKPTVADLLGLESMQTAMQTVGSMPLYYDKRTGKACAVDLREFFSFLVVGPRKSGKTTLLQATADLFAHKNAEIYVLGAAELVAWAQGRGYTAFEHGSEEWAKHFVNILQRIGARDKELQAAKRTGGMQARNRMLETFQPIVILIDEIDKYMDRYADKADLVVNRLTMYMSDNMGGHAIYTICTLSNAAFTATRSRKPLPTMLSAKRGILLQPKLNECDPFNVSLPYNQRNTVYPLGEGLLVTDQGVRHIVCPQCDS